MSKETNKVPAVNIYGILDNEMTRMHQLMQTYLTLPQQDQQYGSSRNYGGLSGSSFSSHGAMPAIYKRILEMQDLMLKALVTYDEVLQNKVAELALTGDTGEAKVQDRI